MKELFKFLLPYICIGAGGLAGIGGTIKYYNKSAKNNGNHWDGQEERRNPAVTKRECDLLHQGLQSTLAEGNRRMSALEKGFTQLNGYIMQHLNK